MKIEDFYSEIGSSYTEIFGRLGNADIILHLVLRFKEDKSFEALEAALEKGNVSAAFRAAHTLKGVTANLGFTALCSESSKITEFLRNGDTESAKKLLPNLSEKYYAVINALNGL